MNEIEKAIKTISDIYSAYLYSETDTVNLRPYDEDLQEVHTVLEQALCKKQENDRLKAEGRVVVLPEPRLPLVWGDENHDTILCPCCKRDLMGGYLLDHHDHPMYQCPHCGQPIDDTASISTEDAEKAIKERENNG